MGWGGWGIEGIWEVGLIIFGDRLIVVENIVNGVIDGVIVRRGVVEENV